MEHEKRIQKAKKKRAISYKTGKNKPGFIKKTKMVKAKPIK